MHYVTTALGNSLRFGARGRVHWSSPASWRSGHASIFTRGLLGQNSSLRTSIAEENLSGRRRAFSQYIQLQSKQPPAMPTSTRRAEGAWRYEPPYVRPEEATSGEGNPFEKKIMGSCHCEMVQFWITRDKPLTAKFCHCSDCKIIHGAPFQWAAIVHKSDIAFVKGTDNLNFLNSGTDKPTHELPCKVRCSNCGSLLMDEGRNMCLLFPTVLRMDREDLVKNFYPDMHIFYDQRIVDIPDGKPKWAGLDEKSEKLDLP